ncbi:MAG TPA: IclR family transcriptional regulator [Micromonospora sp.]
MPLVPEPVAPGVANSGSRQSAISKVMNVLEALTFHDRVSEIGQATGMPTSTVHRILSELVELGWVHFHDHRYVPGGRAIVLIQRLNVHGAAARIALPPLRRLNERTGFTVHLAIVHGYEAVYALKLEGRQAYMMRSRVGDSLALHSSAIGKAVLALMSAEQVAQVADHRGLEPSTDATISDLPTLMSHLDRVREQGWAMDDGENEINVRCIGAAITDRYDRPVGGVSLSAMRFDMTEEVIPAMSTLVVAAARQVSAALRR